MTDDEFRDAPAFARHCYVAAWYVLNPAPEPTKAERLSQASRESKGPPIRDALLPMFTPGVTLRRSECEARLPGANSNTVGTALRRLVELDILAGGGKAGFTRGPKYPG